MIVLHEAMLLVLLILSCFVCSSLGGARFKVFKSQSVVALQSGDSVGAHIIATVIADSSANCVGQCSADDSCRAVQYDNATRNCSLLDSSVDSSSSVKLGLTATNGKFVYSKILQSTQTFDVVANLNVSINLKSSTCDNEVELGLLNGDIPTNGFSASGTCGSSAQSPWLAVYGYYQYGWCQCTSPGWLQVDLGKPKWITKVGIDNWGSWVYYTSSYKLQYSMDPTGVWWSTYKSGSGIDYIFKGPTAQGQAANATLWRPLLARWVRFIGVTYNSNICFRVAIYGCASICREPLGVHSLDVADNQMAASSTACQGKQLPYYGRLNSKRGSWQEGCLHMQDQYLEVDFLKNRIITGIALQGCLTNSYWVTQYLVMYQKDNSDDWYYVADASGNSVFNNANVDSTSAIFQYFDYPIIGRKVHIVPRQQVGSFICLRMEVFGCTAIDAKSYLVSLINSSSVTIFATQGTIYSPAAVVIDGNKDTCARSISTATFHPSFVLDFGVPVPISYVDVTPLQELELNPDGVWVLDIFTRGQDLSGNGNHIYLSKTVTFVNDPFGRPNGAIQLNGDEGAILQGAHYSKTYAVPGDHSVFLWVKQLSATMDHTVMAFHIDNTNWGFHIQLLKSWIRNYRYQLGNLWSGQKYTTQANTWTHIGIMHDSANNRIITYFNGVPDVEYADAVNWVTMAPESFYGGRHHADCQNNQSANAGIFCMQVYNRLLTRREIIAAMRCPWADYKKPLALIALDDVTGAGDISGNGYNATATGTSLATLAQFSNKAYAIGSNSASVMLTQNSLFAYLGYSLSVFVHVTCNAQNCLAFALRDNSSNVIWRLSLFQTNGKHGVQFVLNNGTVVDVSGTANLYYNVRYYVGFTFDYPTRFVTMYIEGSVVATAALSGTTVAPVSGNSIGITGTPVVSAACLQIYNYALSHRQVNLVSTCPLTTVFGMRALAVYSGHPDWNCGNNFSDVIRPTTGTPFINYGGGFTYGGPPAYMVGWGQRSICLGTNGYLQMPLPSYINFTGAFTITTFLYFHTGAPNGAPILHIHNGTGPVIDISYYTSPTISIKASATCASGTIANTVTIGTVINNTIDTVNNNKWFHLAFVFMPGNGKMQLIINGANVVTLSAANCQLMAATQMSFGYTPYSSGNLTAGCFSCIRLFNYPLGLEEISDLMNACPLPSQIEPKQCHADLTTMPGVVVTASTYVNSTYIWGPSNALSVNNDFTGSLACCWQANGDGASSWLQFDFPSVKRISAIATGGITDTSKGGIWYVRQYNLQYAARTGATVNWVYYTDWIWGGNKLFESSNDPTIVSHRRLLPEIDTMYLRILPQTWTGPNPVMRVTLYGCELPTCTSDLLAPLPDGNFSSTIYMGGQSPWFGYIGSANYWQAAAPGVPAFPNYAHVWWQAQFSGIKKITTVRSQGTAAGWVTSYYFKYSREGLNWDGHRGRDGFLQILTGNSDSSTVVERVIGPYFGTVVRIYPQDYSTTISARFGILGCDASWYTPPFGQLQITLSNTSTNYWVVGCSTTAQSTQQPTKRAFCNMPARYLTIGTLQQMEFSLCEISVAGEQAINLAFSRKLVLGGPAISSNMQNVVANGLSTNKAIEQSNSQCLVFNTTGQYFYIDLGGITRITRVVLYQCLGRGDEHITGLDLRVGNSTDITTARFCDSVDGTLMDDYDRRTLWCLDRTYGQYVFIYRTVLTTAIVSIAEVMIF